MLHKLVIVWAIVALALGAMATTVCARRWPAAAVATARCFATRRKRRWR